MATEMGGVREPQHGRVTGSEAEFERVRVAELSVETLQRGKRIKDWCFGICLWTMKINKAFSFLQKNIVYLNADLVPGGWGKQGQNNEPKFKFQTENNTLKEVNSNLSRIQIQQINYNHFENEKWMMPK